MKRSISVIQKSHRKKRKPGRPATGQIPIRSVRLPDEIWDAIAKWRRSRPDMPTQNAAIRHLLVEALELETFVRASGKPGRK
jgi:hypothetical protein